MYRVPGVEYRPSCHYCDLIRCASDLTLEEVDDILVIVHPRPFNSGHLIILPRQHIGFEHASIGLLAKAMSMCSRYIRVLSKLYNPHGFNISFSLAPHFALQLVPRWVGDVSFVSVFHNTRVVSETPWGTLRLLRQMLSST